MTFRPARALANDQQSLVNRGFVFSECFIQITRNDDKCVPANGSAINVDVRMLHGTLLPARLRMFLPKCRDRSVRYLRLPPVQQLHAERRPTALRQTNPPWRGSSDRPSRSLIQQPRRHGLLVFLSTLLRIPASGLPRGYVGGCQQVALRRVQIFDRS